MQTFFLGCKKHNDNIFAKKLIMTYKKIKQKSCSNDITNKSLFYRKKS